MTIGKRVIFATSAALVTLVALVSVFAYELVKRLRPRGGKRPVGRNRGGLGTGVACAFSH